MSRPLASPHWAAAIPTAASIRQLVPDARRLERIPGAAPSGPLDRRCQFTTKWVRSWVRARFSMRLTCIWDRPRRRATSRWLSSVK